MVSVAMSGFAGSREGQLWSRVAVGAPDECWEWQGAVTQYGYGTMMVEKRRRGPHRQAWILTNGDIADGLFVCHSCDNRRCCNPAHLWLGTNDDNMRDRDEKGRGTPPPANEHLIGEAHPNSKITERDVLKIRALVAGGATQTEVASIFGLTQPNVSMIVHGVTWKHVA